MDFWKNYNTQFDIRIIKECVIALLLSAVLSKDLMQFPLWFFGLFILIDMVFMRVDKYLTMFRLQFGK